MAEYPEPVSLGEQFREWISTPVQASDFIRHFGRIRDAHREAMEIPDAGLPGAVIMLVLKALATPVVIPAEAAVTTIKAIGRAPIDIPRRRANKVATQ